MRPYRLLLFLAFASIGLPRSKAAQPINPTQIYAQIKPQSSPARWCSPQSADDPAHIVSSSCEAYSECLGAVDLRDEVDKPPFSGPLFSGLSDAKLGWLRKCHQDLYNAARSNAQIKGAQATQDWLEHSVYPGTEAKPSSAPPTR